MRKTFKTITAATLSAAMLFVPAMTSFAGDDPAANTSTGANGNILAYSAESVVVPTSIQLSLNPNGLEVITVPYEAYEPAEYTKVDAYSDAITEYYKEKSAKSAYYKPYNAGYASFETKKASLYTLVEDEYTAVGSADYDEEEKYFEKVEYVDYELVSSVVDGESFAAVGEDLYKKTKDAVDAVEQKTSKAKILSLNYGCVNKSTMDKINSISFALTYEPQSVESKNIVFVDLAAKAQAYNESTNPDGAKQDEYKIYLAVAASAAAPTVDGTTAFAVTRDASTDYVAEDNADRKALSNVAMNATDKGNVAFVDNEAKIAFKMGAAEYNLKDGATVDFTTTQSQLQNLVEMTELGDVIGFTFVGEINSNADWTLADASRISITPTYDYTKKATDEDEVLDASEGGYKQIATEAPEPPAPAATAPSIETTNYTMSADQAIVVNVDLGSGDKAADGIASITYTKSSGALATLATDKYSFADGKITFSAEYINGVLDANVTNRVYTVKFNDTAETTVDITFTAD